MKNKKKGMELAITKLILLVIAAVFVVVAIMILIRTKSESISVIDAIRDVFIFGP